MTNSVQLCSSEHLFVPGSIFEVTTLHKEIITGEVYAFDYDSRLLILKVNSKKSTKSGTNSSNNSTTSGSNNNIIILNLSLCSEIKQISTPETETDKADPNSKLPDIDFKKLESRLEKAVEERNALTRHFMTGAGTEGVLLYSQLNKTFSGHVKWSADQIIVKGNVAIKPPYKVDSVIACNPKEKLADDSIAYIRSIVDKFWLAHEKPSPAGKNTKKNKT